jgi:hypothetical protein
MYNCVIEMDSYLCVAINARIESFLFQIKLILCISEVGVHADV